MQQLPPSEPNNGYLPVVRIGDRPVALVPIDQLAALVSPPAQPPSPVKQAEPEFQTVRDRGIKEMLTVILWIVAVICGAAVLIQLFQMLSPAAKVERQPHFQEHCEPAGFLGMGQRCDRRQWWQ